MLKSVNLTLLLQFLSSSVLYLSHLFDGGRLVFGCGCELHQVSLDELVDLAIHNSVHIRSLIIGAVILDTAVIEHLASDLAAPLYLFLPCLDLGLLLQTMIHLFLIKD